MLFKKRADGTAMFQPFNKSKLILWILLLVIFLTGIGYISLSVVKFTNKVVNYYDEIKFAFDKPELVKTLREEYASKSAELEEELLNKEPSAEDKLLDEVTNQLKSGKE